MIKLQSPLGIREGLVLNPYVYHNLIQVPRSALQNMQMLKVGCPCRHVLHPMNAVFFICIHLKIIHV